MNCTSAEIGARIKEARKEAGLSQTALAEKIGKTLRTVQKYESGEIEPSIAMINDLSRILNTSPAALIGYKKQDLRLESLADVIFVLNELYKKAGLHFNIEVKRPPRYDEWTCSLIFDGKNTEAEYNQDLCLFLERYARERLCLETYFTSQEFFDRWLDMELAYYSSTMLSDKPVEKLTTTERLQRRNALCYQQAEEEKNADGGDVDE